ncbi:hypothetical protein FPOAC2_12380 [Fusarium poae]|uniref:Uncharacterized protein n=1 Tax=Fusarium poae TaxID=36050 RepID=A0A1B8AG39_FUSPO|nr:hypothetical protein FPOAC1_012049 [Fusarium poae]KAG8667223.1 hypothetical protein FPOAC1_012049 [Fusarium poae]OBS19455.1 hypothetical protein FPOA_11180 [Fusarium poae]
MDSKTRLSVDSINPSPGSSALRRLARSPSHRISLRRFSIDSSSSSASSVVSYDSEASSSCVTRDTSSDDCALHRFIVWAAVKRNACDKLTPQEKLECPMLRCRKRFANHELMLQHLYSCSWLSSSEYWCYDCGKSERFNDSKCKRCLGHPSRRRKILSMAKSFFNSLGHKSKHSTLPDFDLDLDLGDPEAPPSYDLAVAPNELELPSNEIHEIGSSGLALHSIIEDDHENEAEPDLAPMPTPYISLLPIQNRALPNHPAELESDAAPGEPFEFMFPPGTVHPVSLTDTGCNTNLGRPTLQLHTTGLEEYRREQKRRSKGQVAPSTSVRSTASTNSTSSTNTTDTTFSKESYNISPISTYSDQWASAPVFGSDIRLSENGFESPGGLLRANSFAISRKAPAAKGWESLDKKADSSYDSHPRECPTDFPLMGALPSDNTFRDPLALVQPVFTLNDSSLPADFDLASNLALTNDHAVMSPPMNSTLPQPTSSSYHNPRSLISTIWSTLKLHVADSMSKLDHITKNPLVTQLKSLSAETIAANGLRILANIIEGRQPTVPIDILCFVHLGYCFSLIAHEQDATNRSAELFCQAMSYSTSFPRDDRRMYIQTVKALWKPAAISDADVVNIVRAKTSSSMSRSLSLKGKEHEFSNMHQSDADSLVFSAKYFLDQLELATLNVVDDAVIHTSQLYMEHFTMGMHIDSQQASLTLKDKFQFYSHYGHFATALNNLIQRVNSEFLSARRLELHLIEIGKMSLPSHVYFDGYIRYVRNQMDPLYFKNATRGNLRSAYHSHGVELIKTIMIPPLQPMNTQQVQDNELPNGLPDSVMKYAFDEDLDFFNNPTASETFDFGENLPFDAGQPLDYVGLSSSINTSTLNPQPLPTPADTSSVQATPTAANSPPTPAPTAFSASTAKIKSDTGCTLCNYTPKGDPRWFSCSLSKHMRLQHSTKPPIIYRCQYPGCTSQYKNRPDNLRQHQIEKGHFTDGQDSGKRSNKRRKVE